MSNNLISALAAGLAPRPRMLTASPVTETGWFRILESFAGAFQGAVTAEAPRNLLAFSPIYASVTRISGDIAKLCLDLYEEDDDDIWTKAVYTSPYRAVLVNPNHYQNRIQFFSWWIVSKLLAGNMYALKERDRRGLVRALYILDPRRITPLVASNGDVYYELQADDLAGIGTNVTVPAREIIHDRMECLWHPLVGISPLYAAALSGTLGRRIQENSTRFFQNLSRPSGILTAPGKISDPDAAEYKKRWEENYGGANVGRVAVLGNGLKYEGVGTIAPEQAQLVEQFKLAREDVATAFKVPLFKIGGALPQGVKPAELDLVYYKDCLQELIEAAELCLDEGLELPAHYHTMFDVDDLLRMDSATRYEAYGKGVSGGWMHPNFPRARENMAPVEGGDTPYLQQQNFALKALARRDAKDDPFAAKSGASAPAAAPVPTGDPAAYALIEAQVKTAVEAAIQRVNAQHEQDERARFEDEELELVAVTFEEGLRAAA